MPIVTNPDQSMSYVDNPPQDPSVTVPKVNTPPPATSAPTLRRMQQTPPQTDIETPPETEQEDAGPVLRKGVEGRPSLTAASESSKARDAAGGALTGLLWVPNAILTHIEAGVNIPAHKGKDGVLIKPSEWAGYTEDEWDQLSYAKKKAILHEEFEQSELKTIGGADKDSIPYLLGNLAGMVASTPYPMAPASAAFRTRVAVGAGAGAADLSLYESARGQWGKEDLLLGGGIGAVAGAFSRGGKSMMGHKDPKVRKGAQDTLNKIDARLGELMNKNGAVLSQASKQVLKEFKLSDEGLEILHRDAGSAGAKLPERGPRNPIDKLIEPIYDRMYEISPRFTKATQEILRKQMDHARQLERIIDPFTKQFSNFPGRLGSTKVPGVARDLKTAMLIGDSGMFKAAISKAGSKVASKYDDYKKAHDEMYKLLEEVRSGRKNTPLGSYKDVFMHRAVKDVGELRKWMKDKWGRDHVERVDRIIKEVAPDGASDAELGRIFSRYLFGQYDPKSLKLTPKGTRARRLKKEDFEQYPELVDFFHDPAPATNNYIRETLRDYYYKTLFGTKVVDKFGDEINEELFSALAKEYKIKDNVEEFKTLLGAVLVDGVRSPHVWISRLKNLTYTGLLGNFWSALTQTGDLVLSAAIHGGVNTMDGVWKTVLGRGMSPKEMGMMAAITEEFVSTGKTSKILHYALNASGFRSIDQLGKAVNMTAAISKAQTAIKTPKSLRRFINEYGAAYGDDFDNLLDALQNWDKTQEAMYKIHKNLPVTSAEEKMVSAAKSYAFGELAKLQPNTMLEMPYIYNKHPNFRIAYMLKTFQMKYFNALRKNFWYELKRGNRTKAVHLGAGLFLAYVAGGVGTDHVKNWLAGKDNYANDIFYDNMLRAASGPLFLDRYSTNKFATSSDPLPKLVENVLPPVGFWSPEFVTLMRAVTPGEGMRDMPVDKMVGQIPIMGKPLYYWMFGGAEEWNAKRWSEKT